MCVNVRDRLVSYAGCNPDKNKVVSKDRVKHQVLGIVLCSYNDCKCNS